MVAASSSQAGASPEPLVAVARDVHVTLSRDQESHHVLRGVDLDIARGEILGLVGESGSGKSVLGLTFLGLLRREARPQVTGALTIDGVDMLAASPAELRQLRRERLGAIFQDPMTSLDPTMRVGRQLREVVDSDADAIELLGAVGIPDPERRLRAYPHELSGGLRQRVMIAIAVAGNPQLIVADEPTTALDVTIQAQILSLLDRLRRELGCSIILITHDLAVASQVADRVAVLYAGRIAEIGPTADLLTAPRHPYTAALLRSRLDLDSDRARRIIALAGQPPDLRQPPPGCPFAPRCAYRREACEAALPEVSWDGRHGVACVRAQDIDLRRQSDDGVAWEAQEPEVAGRPALRANALDVSVARGSWPRRLEPIRILEGVSLTVAQGEAVALVGESGSGKTTFIRAAAGLMPITGGELEVADSAPQMIFQDAGSSLTPWLSVGELIGERLRAAGTGRTERRAQVLEAMATVGLPDRLINVRPAQLSGGQRQRVAIARAVVVPPRLLLCDEPTSALDVSVAAGVLNLLGDLRRRLGMALVFVTHDLAVARVIADRVAVMHAGRIVEVGPIDDVLQSPSAPYTRTLIASIPGLHEGGR
jgi:peptide/nickel transport system ATP-binding protein